MNHLNRASRSVLFLSLAFNAVIHAASPTPAPDPLLGRWVWYNKTLVTFAADGTSTTDRNAKGAWVYLQNAEAQRKYRVTWDSGKFVDTVILAEDGKTALLLTEVAGRQNIHRAAD